MSALKRPMARPLRSGLRPAYNQKDGTRKGTVIVPRNSLLIAAYALGTTLSNSLRRFNIAATGEATFDSHFGEFGNGAVLYYSSSSPADSGTLATKTLAIDNSKAYNLDAKNGNWTNDKCVFNLEFLDASDNVVCVVKSPGTGSYAHVLQYGASLGSVVSTGTTGTYYQTGGNITFEAGLLRFTNTTPTTNYNNSFTFACNAKSITKVRISGVRAHETYSDASSGAWVRFQKIF